MAVLYFRMVRERLMAGHRDKDDVEWRGHEVTRLEGFSDAVFGFALTLLVVSQQVPYTFDDLTAILRGFLSFALCFWFLALIWYLHYLFFRRYGLIDTFTTRLNSILLFIVLFYVYPLKFLCTVLVAYYLHIAPPEMLHANHVVITARQFPVLIAIYGLGQAAVFGVFSLLYEHAYRLRAALALTEREAYFTRVKVLTNAGAAGIGLLSAAVAGLAGPYAASIAGLCYVLIPALGVSERIAMRRYGGACLLPIEAQRGEQEPTPERVGQGEGPEREPGISHPQ